MEATRSDSSSGSGSSASSSSSSLDEASLRQATTEAEVMQAQDADIVASAAISARERQIHGTGAAQPVFLSPGQAGECVSMASYPRSGNSMLRALLEGATGVVTGSDSRPDRNMARDLALYGLVGEGDTGEHGGGGRVWIVKTHFPERYGWREFGSQRTLLLVRNPVRPTTTPQPPILKAAAPRSQFGRCIKCERGAGVCRCSIGGAI